MSSGNENQTGSIRPYEVDGIQECDNPLPTWWIGLFVSTLIFSVAYMAYYHLMGGDDLVTIFNKEMEERANQQEQEMVSIDSSGSGPDSVGEGSGSAVAEETDLAEAQQVWDINCASCHKTDGSGLIGPNLTDNMWVHGGSAEDIAKIIEVGVLEKGMPPWKDVLGRRKIKMLTDLIVSWRGKNIKGKAAEGEPYSE